MENIIPKSPDPLLKKGADMMLIRAGHLNKFITEFKALKAIVDGITDGGSSFDTISELTTGLGVTIDSLLIKDGGITSIIPNKYALGTTITAGATQTQAGATLLTKEFNNVTIVATAGDGVRLPTAEAGLSITVKNTAANALKVYPFLADFIDDEIVNAGVTIPAEATVTFKAISATTWESNMETVVASSIVLPDGLVSNLAVKIGADFNNGLYGVSDTQLGVAIEGVLVALFDTLGLAASEINEIIGGVGVTVDGLLIKDGVPGKLSAVTTTAAGLTTGALTGANQFVAVTSASANDVMCLPAEATTPVGTVITGWVGANGFELRPIAAEAATATINGVTTSVEAAIPATTKFRIEKVAALTWILTATDELGAVIAAIVPDAL